MDEEKPDGELYALLHLSPEASDEEIRRAYRQWAQVYHPDKHQTPQMQGIATESFQKIREAYEVLSDERKRKIYDLYGTEGLNSGMELGPKVKSVDEFLKEFEKLKKHRQEHKKLDQVHQSGSLVVNIALAENGPVLRGMTSATELQARISRKSSLVLGGNISIGQELGGGTLSALFRHQISSDADVEILAMAGLQSLVSIQTSRRLSSHATGGIGLSLSLINRTVNLTNSWTRQLSDTTEGSIQLVIGPETGVSVALQRHGERDLGSTELKVGPSGFGIMAQYHHEFSGHSQGRLTGRLGSTAVEVEIGGERRISSQSALAMFCTIGIHGISYKFRFSRGGQKFSVPILLTPALNPLIATGALLLPTSIYVLLKSYVIKPYFLRRKEVKRRERRSSSAAQIREARAKASKAQLLLKNVADRKRDRQLKNGGLVIKQAIYGSAHDLESNFDVSLEEEDNVPPPVLDVTTTLNFLVENEQLQLHDGVKKSGLIGFCDPCPGERKKLKVIYTFRNQQFEVVVGDFDELTIPDAAHLQAKNGSYG
ncbi:hypothetical protein GOP47_0014273 [Adiantum capillus-veneris]|uniref:J domain-containing protein n=1 Tax=Adiantum capillus-veneris TaxID=13818 RepID=A0A9D4UL55_ADICA|nr:hypothetical protein GOP47_0014273 [Adiantum capillus-veneris]